MKVTILENTPNPVKLIYMAFRICYSKDTPTNIDIPKRNFYPIDSTEPLCKVNDNKKMSDFIKDKLGKGHESPLEHVSFTFAIEGVSRALSHQLVRHRTFKFSQQSQRYVNGENFDFIAPGAIKDKDFEIQYLKCIDSIKDLYGRMVRNGTPKEDARYLLPNATTTNLIVTCDLRNFRHFYMERSCIHAQWEIRELAKEMMKLVKERVPFADYNSIKCGITCNECMEDK